MRSSPEVQQSDTKRPLFSRNVGKIAQRAAGRGRRVSNFGSQELVGRQCVNAQVTSDYAIVATIYVQPHTVQT